MGKNEKNMSLMLKIMWKMEKFSFSKKKIISPSIYTTIAVN